MEVSLQLSDPVARFYSRIAAASGLPLEQVLNDALFKLAGELSLQSLRSDFLHLHTDISDIR